MFIDLMNFPDEGKDISGIFKIPEIADREEKIGAIGPVHLSLAVQKKSKRFLFDGRISTVVFIICSRCLKRKEVPVDSVFHLEYAFLPPHVENEVKIKKEDLSLAYVREEEAVVSVKEIIIEQVLLALPMKPLCVSDCKGLCPTCGCDRNLEECDCFEESLDPRLAPLLNFKKKLIHKS